MEVMCRDELVPDPLPLEVSADATAAEVLRDACALFGRAEEDTALEVGGVVWEADNGDVSASRLGLEADSTVVLRRGRVTALAIAQQWRLDMDPRSLPDWVWADDIVVLAAVSRCGSALSYANAALRNNERVVGAAVVQETAALKYASSRLRGNETFVRQMVRQHWQALLYATAALWDADSVIAAAVRQSGTALRFSSERLRANEEIVLEAVRQNGVALEYASAALQDNEAVVDAAVEQTRTALKYASGRLQIRYWWEGGVVRGVSRWLAGCFSSIRPRETDDEALATHQQNGL